MHLRISSVATSLLCASASVSRPRATTVAGSTSRTASYSYWRFLERDGGTYIESESISLTRTIPFMVRWLLAPFVNDMPREQLTDLLQTTRQALVND